MWSGRRGSNPRPTAWKAVTLPLSYSRSDTSVVACSANPEWVVARGGFEPPKPLGRQIYSLLRLTAPQPRRLPAAIRPPHTRRHPHTHRKAGRSLPKRCLELYWNSLCIVWMAPTSPCFAFVATGAGEGIRTPDPLITNQPLYRTELRQPDKFLILAHTMPARNGTRILGFLP